MLVAVAESQIPLFQAAKDKSGKFHDNFNVTLFLVRPNDQTLQEEFSRSNMICQVTRTEAQSAITSPHLSLLP